MTAKTRFNKTCNICGNDLICPECGVPSKNGTPFSNWIRDTELEASCHDIDFVWHNYRENWFITIEEKRFYGKQSISQKDTQSIVFQMLRASSGRQCLTLHGWQNIEYRGHYIIVFENSTPDDGEVYINGTQASKEQVINLLKTGKREVNDVEQEIADEIAVRTHPFQEKGA